MAIPFLFLVLVPVILASYIDLIDGIREVYSEDLVAPFVQKHSQCCPFGIAVLSVTLKNIVVGGDVLEEDRFDISVAPLMGHFENIHVYAFTRIQ